MFNVYENCHDMSVDDLGVVEMACIETYHHGCHQIREFSKPSSYLDHGSYGYQLLHNNDLYRIAVFLYSAVAVERYDN